MEFIVRHSHSSGLFQALTLSGFILRALTSRVCAVWEGGQYLVTEDLDLAHSPVHQLAAATATVVGVDLQVQGDSLHPLLGGEVCAQAVHPNKHLQAGTGAVGAGNLHFSPARAT